MSSKNSAEINVGFPIYGLRFINSKTLLAVGGGGEGNNGIPNKITAIKCHFNAPDKNRRLQKFREITLPSNEDSPMCVDVSRVVDDDHVRYSLFVGCNQSTQLVKSMSINNNLRKYHFTDEEHLRFVDAVQFDENVLPESVGEYPKIVHLTPDNTVGALMTSKVPLEIYIFNPETLVLGLRYEPQVSGEVKDFHLSGHDEGQSLVYITASVIEAISSSDGSILSSTTKAPKATANKLAKYFFSKVRFVGESRVVVAAALRSGKGAAIFEYDLAKQKITNERVISTKMKGVVAIDISAATGIIAAAGNDFSVTLIRASDLKVIKVFPNLHKFAITSLSFAPNGKRLATGSASNTLNVVNIPAKIASSGSLIGTLFQYLFFIVLVAGLAIFVQNAKATGNLDQYIELSKQYGGEAFVQAQHYSQHYGKIFLELSKKYGDEYFHKAQHYGYIGYELLKEKSIEGIDALKEKLNKDDKPTWVDEVDEAGTHIASTMEDIVSEVTRDIDELTSGLSDEIIDTQSIIDAAVSKQTIIKASELDSASSELETIELSSKIEESSTSTPGTEAVETPSVSESTVAESSRAIPSSESAVEVSSVEPEVKSSASSLESSIEKVETESVEISNDLQSETAAGTIPEATVEDLQIEEPEIAAVEPIESETIAEPIDESTAQPVPEVESVVPETEESVPTETPVTSVEKEVEGVPVESVAEIIADEIPEPVQVPVNETETRSAEKKVEPVVEPVVDRKSVV